MSDMLPVEPAHARSLTDVLPTVFDAVQNGASAFGSARSAVVLLIDGLGAANLASRAGHARFLSGAKARKDVARSVFPTTTGAAITSLTTGADAGAHGIVGYSARIPGTPRVANLLSGWDDSGLDPETWQLRPTLWEQHPHTPGFVVSTPKYRDSGFSRAAFRGAEFIGIENLEERLLEAVRVAAAHDGSVVYTYIPDLDQIAHKFGWESDRWVAMLERVDAAVREMANRTPADVGLVVTADHGVVDVPHRSHVLLRTGDDLLDDVEVIAGEPRMLHLYTASGQCAGVAERWRASEGHRAWVLTREDAIAHGLFGAVDEDVTARIGDVLVAPRALVAYYDDRLADKNPQKMIGQHGSLTAEERIVPLIRLGAFARA